MRLKDFPCDESVSLVLKNIRISGFYKDRFKKNIRLVNAGMEIAEIMAMNFY